MFYIVNIPCDSAVLLQIGFNKIESSILKNKKMKKKKKVRRRRCFFPPSVLYRISKKSRLQFY